MKTDAELKEVLRNWEVQVELPSGFQRDVWRHIAARAEQYRFAWLKNFFGRLAESIVVPRYAMALAVVALLAGISLGYLQGGHSASSLSLQLEARYADSINPLSQTRLEPGR